MYEMSNRGRHRKKKFNKITVEQLQEIVDNLFSDELSYVELNRKIKEYVKQRKT